MTSIKIKKLYDTGSYVCYKYLQKIWTKIEIVDWSSNAIHRLIHKNHESIADYVITNPKTIVEVKLLTDKNFHPNFTTDDFFLTYNPEIFDYRLKPEIEKLNEDFNGGYIEASQEAYDLLVKLDLQPLIGVNTEVYLIWYTDIDDKKIDKPYFTSETFNTINTKTDAKQFYINNSKLSWEKPLIQYQPPFADISIPKTEIEEFYGATEEDVKIVKDVLKMDNKDFESHCNDIFGKESKPILSITAPNETIYKFEKPEFKYSGLFITEGVIIGALIDDNVYAMKWSLGGKSIGTNGDILYNLVPIKKPWYEDKKFPAYGFIVDTDYEPAETPIIIQGYNGDIESGINLLYNHNTIDNIYDEIALESVRLATKKEIDSIHYEGKE